MYNTAREQTPVSIAISPGEPAGIGIDLLLLLAKKITEHLAEAIECVIYADPRIFENRAQKLNLCFKLNSKQQLILNQQLTCFRFHNINAANPLVCGTPDPRNAHYVLECLSEAAQSCINKKNQALITGPIHKAVINQAGIPFTGHTEFLAKLAGVDDVVMMLATENLRVALATTHVPLKEVSAHLTREHLTHTIEILAHDLTIYFGIPTPTISICGLNPHAGENGFLGREEIDVITPVMNQLKLKQQNRLTLLGPTPADTAFTPHALQGVDAVLAMYHDQGLPVLKYAGFGQAVNITLGLPFIRTSVDHGTALDLAGTGQIDGGSFEMALKTAIMMVQNINIIEKSGAIL